MQVKTRLDEVKPDEWFHLFEADSFLWGISGRTPDGRIKILSQPPIRTSPYFFPPDTEVWVENAEEVIP